MSIVRGSARFMLFGTQPYPALLATQEAVFTVRQRSPGRHEGPANSALHKLFDCVSPVPTRPLPSTAPGFGRETAEAVRSRRLFGQPSTDRGEDTPHDEEHNDDQQDALHETVPRGRV